MNAVDIWIGGLGRGGTETHLTRTLPALKDLGWDIRVFLLSNEKTLAPLLEQHNIPVIGPTERHIRYIRQRALPRWAQRLGNILWNTARLWHYYRTRQHQLTHFYLPQAYILGTVVALLCGKHDNILMSRRSLNEYHSSLLLKYLERKLHGLPRAIIGNSEAVVRQLITEEHVNRQRTHLIYNGVVLPTLLPHEDKQQQRQDLKLPTDKVILILVANLIPYKGHTDLLQALSLLKHLPWHLLCLGQGTPDYQRDLQKQARSLGLSDHISWLGSQPDVNRYLVIADIGLLVSHQEGFSNALLEYMAAGLAVIATDVGGNAESIQHGKTGYLVPARAPEELAIYIAKVINNNERHILGAAGRARVQECFQIERCVTQHHHLYKSCLCVA